MHFHLVSTPKRRYKLELYQNFQKKFPSFGIHLKISLSLFLILGYVIPFFKDDIE